jgi:hypothetical protein
MTNPLEIIVGKEKITADRIMSFGFDPNYLAIVGNDIYFKQNDGTYKILLRDFRDNKQVVYF